MTIVGRKNLNNTFLTEWIAQLARTEISLVRMTDTKLSEDAQWRFPLRIANKQFYLVTVALIDLFESGKKK